MAKGADINNREWFTVDAAATDLTLGRLATKIATVLMGKHKPIYTPHIDTGDFVVVLNADKIKVTGSKAETKEYPYFTLYPSGYRTKKFKDLIVRDPEQIIKLAVQRMLPKSKLGRIQLTKLRCYKGTTHPHTAQKPQPLDLNKV